MKRPKFGGSKTIRDGMGQSQVCKRPSPMDACPLRLDQRPDPGSLGHRQGRHWHQSQAALSRLAKPGNPDAFNRAWTLSLAPVPRSLPPRA